MAGERLVRILDRLWAEEQAEPGSTRLCEVCAEVTAMSGAGVMVMSGEGAQASVCTTDEVVGLMERLQFTLGEGPCIDAYRQGRPVIEPDLAGPASPRWLAFAPPAVEAGARAVFAFPLRVGAVRFGSLNLYRDVPGPLGPDQHADSMVMADVAAMAVIAMQAKVPPGALAAELEDGAGFLSVVHQASGVASVHLGVSLGEALVRLRAHAYAQDRPLGAVAHDVVGGRLRLD